MPEVKLIVNEKEIPLKDFMEGMLTNMIIGYLKSTRMVPKNEENIKVDIKIPLKHVSTKL